MHFWFQKWEPLCGAHPRSLHKPGWNLGCRKGIINTITYVLFSYSSERKPSRPSLRSYLRPSKVAPTTLQSPCQGFSTTFKVSPTTLWSHTYDPQIPLSEASLRPSKSHLRPSKVAPTTLQSLCQQLPYDPQSLTYDPSKLRLRPSNPLVRSSQRPFSHFGCLHS